MRKSRRFDPVAALVPLTACLSHLGCQHVSETSRARPAAAMASVPTATQSAASTGKAVPPAPRHVIVFVWDGLRPDSVNPQDTPRLSDLAHDGSVFPDHHATYPTFTMMNAASFATGGRPLTTGFYGNSQWEPEATRRSVDGAPLLTDAGAPNRYAAPIFTEDYLALRDLDAFYHNELLASGTLFDAVHARGWVTAAIGKSGAAYLQDRHEGGYILDEKGVWPLSLVGELQAAGIPLPKPTPSAYRPGQVTIDAALNGDPTTFPAAQTLADKKSTDPTDESGAPAHLSNAYMMDAYLSYVLPTKRPDLSLIWLRNPDTAQHWYGPGTADARRSLRDMDALLGKLIEKLATLGWLESTDLVVVSDHGHNTVSGRLDLFPLRAIAKGAGPGQASVGGLDPAGYSVSGDVRLAALLTRVGGFHAFDGSGCLFDPVLSGITKAGTPLYPVHTDDEAGSVCGKDPKTGLGGMKYNTPAYRMPATLPDDALVVAVNGGSDFIYSPLRNEPVVLRAVKFLQGREEVGPIFLSSHYPATAGTLPMTALGIEAKEPRRTPDIVISYNYDENASVAGMRGIEYESAQNYRGMHGSFSPIDVHSTFVASGPDFRKRWNDPLPTANVDIAPTVARLLGIELPQAEGRPLDEALTVRRAAAAEPSVENTDPIVSATATGVRMFLPNDTNGTHLDADKSKYHVVLKTRKLTADGKTYTYYDWAKAVRE